MLAYNNPIRKKDEPLFTVTEIKPGIYHIHEAAVHFDLIVGEKKALLWDTGYGIYDILTLVKSLSDKELIVCNSHGHIDHVGGNYAFDKVLIPLRAVPEAIILSSHALRSIGVKRIFDHGDVPRHDYSNVIYEDLNDTMVFDLGKRTARFIAIPGHTANDLALFIEEDGLLFTADAINYSMWLYFSDGMKQSTVVASLTKLIALNPVSIIASHRHSPLSLTYLIQLRDCIRSLRLSDFKDVHIDAFTLRRDDLVEYHTNLQNKRVSIVFREDAFDLNEKEGP
jgi:glyoxylase-like metal-dependent hydrolase (beta-lactamase superfamily II)